MPRNNLQKVGEEIRNENGKYEGHSLLAKYLTKNKKFFQFIRTKKVVLFPCLWRHYFADAVPFSNRADLVDVNERRSFHVFDSRIKDRTERNLNFGSAIISKFAVLDGLMKESLFVGHRCVKTCRARRGLVLSSPLVSTASAMDRTHL